MYKIHTRPLLALLALILASLACQTPAATITKGLITCEYAGYQPGPGNIYYCTCPVNGIKTNLSLDELNSFEEDRVYRETCGGIDPPAPQPQPSATPTDVPAAPPTEPPAASAPLKPYLAGTFTTCDNLSRYVNFTVADDAPPYDPATFKILFNGQEITCTPAASDSKVTTCIYPPAPYGPPATIEVYIGEERVNEFTFDGGKICDPAPVPQNNSGGDAAPTEPPAATGEPGSSD